MPNQEIEAASRLVLEGVRTLRTAAETNKVIRDSLEKTSTLEIELSGIVEADLSFIQILLAAWETARRSNRTVRLVRPASHVIRQVLERGGFPIGDFEPISGQHQFWLPMGEV
jgi:ABC-type transporter Mla MlaB component